MHLDADGLWQDAAQDLVGDLLNLGVQLAQHGSGLLLHGGDAAVHLSSDLVLGISVLLVQLSLLGVLLAVDHGGDLRAGSLEIGHDM